jgi:hypothetical protein
MNKQTSENQDKIKKHRGLLIHHSVTCLVVANGLLFIQKSALSHAVTGEIWRNPLYLFGWLLLLANLLVAIKSALALRKAQSEKEGTI